MPTRNTHLTVCVTPLEKQKINRIAALDGRTASNLFYYLLSKEIRQYEAEHGEIELSDAGLPLT